MPRLSPFKLTIVQFCLGWCAPGLPAASGLSRSRFVAAVSLAAALCVALPVALRGQTLGSLTQGEPVVAQSSSVAKTTLFCTEVTGGPIGASPTRFRVGPIGMACSNRKPGPRRHRLEPLTSSCA